MERQLAGLSTLVRSALVNQNAKDESPDMMDLGRRLLEMQSDAVERFGLTSATNSNTSSIYNSSALMSGKQLLQVSGRLERFFWRARSFYQNLYGGKVLDKTFKRFFERATIFLACGKF